MSKRKGLFDLAEPVYDSGGNISSRICPRCKQPSPFGRNNFLRSHGVGKCELAPEVAAASTSMLPAAVYGMAALAPTEAAAAAGVPWPVAAATAALASEAAEGAEGGQTIDKTPVSDNNDACLSCLLPARRSLPACCSCRCAHTQHACEAVAAILLPPSAPVS
jgi:hypothetical protein